MQSSIKKTEIAEREIADCLAGVKGQDAARKILEECITRYHAGESNFEATRKINKICPDSFYAHLISALHKTENRLLGTDRMAYYAYQCLDCAKAQIEGADGQDFELLSQVETILHHETEMKMTHYDY